MKCMKDMMSDMDDFGSSLYRGLKKDVAYVIVASMLLPSGCRKPETEYLTEAEMSKYVESVLDGRIKRVDKDLRMTRTLPPTADSWVTVNVDYKVSGKEDVYLELFSVDDGLDGNQKYAIELAKDNGLLPIVHIIHSGKESDIDAQIKAAGL